MKLVKNSVTVADEWTTVADDGELPEGGAVIVSLARFKAERDTLVGRNAPIGLRLKSNEQPAILAEDLERFSVVALEFPIFRDGRAYSHASQLRGPFRLSGRDPGGRRYPLGPDPEHAALRLRCLRSAG